MSRILRRPMFRGGRVAKREGGLSQIRVGYEPVVKLKTTWKL